MVSLQLSDSVADNDNDFKMPALQRVGCSDILQHLWGDLVDFGRTKALAQTEASSSATTSPQSVLRVLEDPWEKPNGTSK